MERIPFIFEVVIAVDISQYIAIFTRLLAIIRAHKNHIKTYRLLHTTPLLHKLFQFSTILPAALHKLANRVEHCRFSRVLTRIGLWSCPISQTLTSSGKSCVTVSLGSVSVSASCFIIVDATNEYAWVFIDATALCLLCHILTCSTASLQRYKGRVKLVIQVPWTHTNTNLRNFIF